MPEISKESLREKIRRREIAPAYALYGAELYLRDLAAKTIANLSFSAADMRDFNEDEFCLDTPGNLTSALAAANQLPMMASRRVIRITGVRVAAAAQRDTLKEEFEEPLAAYLANPSPHSVIIFIADELNGNRRIAKLLKNHCVAVEFERLQGQELLRWARNKFDDLGTRIDDAALRHLVSLVGDDLCRMDNEIVKLSTAALPENVVSSRLIDELVPYSRVLSNFDLTDHLAAGRRREALAALRKILDDGAEPIALLGLIAYNFRRLLTAKVLMAAGTPRADVARAVKLRYSDQEPFFAAARRAEILDLVAVIKRTAEADLAIKTSIGGGGPQGSRLQIEMLVSSILNGGNQ